MDDIEGHYDELFLQAMRSARRILVDRDEAADVASEAVARAFVRWDRIGSYAPAWVTRVAVNLALDRLRRRPVLTDPSAFGSAGTARAPSEDRLVLAQELARLPRRQREVLVLRFLVDLDEQSTAELLGLSIGTVHTHATRGLDRVRRRLPAGFRLEGEPA